MPDVYYVIRCMVPFDETEDIEESKKDWEELVKKFLDRHYAQGIEFDAE